MSAKKESGGKKEIAAPRGTHDILGEEYFIELGFMEKASEIALYYGFEPVETPMIEDESLFSHVGEYTDIVQKEMYTLKTKGGAHLALRPEGTAPVLRAYIEHGMHKKIQPVMLFYGGPFFRHDRPQRGRTRQFKQFGLEVIGTEKSIADATIIRIILTILEEAGMTNLCVDINSLGDKECRTAFRKQLALYFKKYTNKMNTHEKELLKKNPLRLLDSKNEDLKTAIEGAPESLEHLSGPAKQHFKEVLEYLDALSIPYQINSRLVRGLDYYSRTVFEIINAPKEAGVEAGVEDGVEGDGDDKETEYTRVEFANGGRYDTLARAIGAREDIPGVGAAIGISRAISLGYGKNLKPRILKRPKVYFIQIGFEAKLKSLGVIEILRRARLPVKQSLSKDSLSAQLGTAESLGIPWVIILGQKEVLEDSVIVRNMNDRSQKTVKIDTLPEYIKKVIAK